MRAQGTVLFMVLFCTAASTPLVWGDEIDHRTPQSAVTAAATAALAQADVALARSIISPGVLNQIKGEVAERAVNQSALAYLQQSGNWQSIQARQGPQGFDGLHLRVDRQGNPRAMLVVESKYNTAELGVTRDGIQMGNAWKASRFRSLATRYQRLGVLMEGGRIEPARLFDRNSARSLVDVPLKDGRIVTVWRDGSVGPWKFDGAAQDRGEVVSQLNKLSDYFRAAAEERITYRSQIFQVKPVSEGLQIAVKDAADIDRLGPEFARLPTRREFVIPLSGNRLQALRAMTAEEIQKVLRRQMPHLADDDIRHLAAGSVRGVRDMEQSLSAMGRPLWRQVTMTSVAAGGVAAVLDPLITIGVDLWTGRRIEPARLAMGSALAMVSVAIGAEAGQATVIVMTHNPVLNQFAQRTSAVLGLNGTSILSRGMGMSVGGGVAAIITSYGQYLLGWTDLQTANRMAIAGTASMAGGVVFTTGTMGLIATFGTASTGTAISGLSGAAASSASLAWLGGGATAAGGGGVFVGSIVMTGGVIVVAAVIGGGVMYAFHYYDEKREHERLQLTIQDLLQREEWSGRGVRTTPAP